MHGSAAAPLAWKSSGSRLQSVSRAATCILYTPDSGRRAGAPPAVQNYQGGEFSLFFANCEPYSAIDFDVEVALFNVRGECARYSRAQKLGTVRC